MSYAVQGNASSQEALAFRSLSDIISSREHFFMDSHPAEDP